MRFLSTFFINLIALICLSTTTALAQNSSNGEVIDYMREKYGDYVLLKPPIQNNTYALWVLPFLLLLGGLIWFIKAGANGAPRDENGRTT